MRLPTECWANFLLFAKVEIIRSVERSCGQHVEFRSRCLLSRSELYLQISSYPNFSRYRVGTDLCSWASNPSLDIVPHLQVLFKCSYS